MRPSGFLRRDFLKTLVAGSVCAWPAAAIEPQHGVSGKLLDEIERRACLYFYEMADPDTGLVRDRAVADEGFAPGAASIAATGFGLSALAIGSAYGYLDPELARARARRTLSFLCDRAAQERGFFYHFLDSSSGARIWGAEASSVDTGWLLCGALHAGEYWDDPAIRSLSSELIERADWQWMLDGQATLCHGWKPEGGFLRYRWDAYSELLAMYLLAITSLNHSIPATAWNSFARPMRDYEGIFYIDAATPLFVHQYSHAWFDFRGRADRYANYFRNSARATEAHRRYCIELAAQYPWYGPDMWGITASDSRTGYRIWGSPTNPPDGTLAPCAAGGSLVFLPDSCGTVLENMFAQYGKNVWTKYGFVDAFHPGERWFSREIIGIDQGITLLMAENARTGSVWQAVMNSRQARLGMGSVGLALHPDV